MNGFLSGATVLLAGVLATAGCKHYEPSRKLDHAVTEAVFKSAASPPTRELSWEIVDRFRLVASPGGTKELFRRYASYYRTVSTQINDEGMLGTWWDPATSRYRDGYVKFDTWKIRLTAPFEGECLWTLGQSEQVRAPCDRYEREVRSGETQVSVRPAGSQTGNEKSVLIRPRDVLIASLGDSYASGEGVPDLRRYWSTPAVWMDERCHRSLFSGPGLAALMYAAVNPHVSVTHLTFACSGAELKEGLLEPYAGAVPAKDGTRLKPQVEALKEALAGTGRTPDFVTISAGGNDIGFADIVYAATTSSMDTVKATITRRVPAGIERVEGLAPQLKTALLGAGISASSTQFLLTEYPNPTRLWQVPKGLEKSADALRNACGNRGGGTINFTPSIIGLVFTIDPKEIAEIEKTVSTPLRSMLKRMEADLGARLVEGIDEDFGRHGYCAPGLFLESGKVRWINTLQDSTTLLNGRTGAMHPNIRGQNSIARHLLDNIRNAECASGRIAADDPVRKKLCDSPCWNVHLPGYGPSADTVPDSEQFTE